MNQAKVKPDKPSSVKAAVGKDQIEKADID
jgi:hypothetical protein